VSSRKETTSHLLLIYLIHLLLFNCELCCLIDYILLNLGLLLCTSTWPIWPILKLDLFKCSVQASLRHHQNSSGRLAPSDLHGTRATRDEDSDDGGGPSTATLVKVVRADISGWRFFGCCCV
jgi:hypothetical protein